MSTSPRAKVTAAHRPGRHDTVTRISLIVPMLNEARHVEHFVADLATQDFDGELELLVADGGSTDGSPDLLRDAATRHGLRLIVLGNDAGWVSHGLNACIARASGELLVRLDCHSRYPPDYLRRCAVASAETGALVVGGVIVANGHTLVERAVACAMDSPFGGIGFYRIFSSGDGGPLARLGGAFGLGRDQHAGTAGRVETDTATFGAFRPQVFDLVGTFDESLRRNQDDEFNLRVRRAGEKVILDPAIRVYYTPRGSFGGVFRQYFEYGYWKVAVMRKHGELPGPRSLVPAVFVGSVGTLALAAALRAPARWLLGAELAAYTGAALAAGASTVRRRGESAGLIPVAVAVFPAFHVGYGSGMLRGALRLAARTAAGRTPRF